MKHFSLVFRLVSTSPKLIMLSKSSEMTLVSVPDQVDIPLVLFRNASSAPATTSLVGRSGSLRVAG